MNDGFDLDGATKSEHDEAVDLATQSKIGYDEALREVRVQRFQKSAAATDQSGMPLPLHERAATDADMVARFQVWKTREKYRKLKAKYRKLKATNKKLRRSRAEAGGGEPYHGEPVRAERSHRITPEELEWRSLEKWQK